MGSNKAFYFEGTKSPVLLIHGYTGGPYDLKPLGAFLHRKGHPVVGVRLKGHGTKPKDLAGVTLADWHHDIKKGMGRFATFDGLSVIGLSVGALLAIALAACTKEVTKLVLLSPALKFKTLAETIIFAAQRGLIPKSACLPKLSGGSDIADEAAKKRCPSYQEMPIEGLLEAEKLRVSAIEQLPSTLVPIFAAFGKYDGAIDVQGSKSILRRHVKESLFIKEYGRSKHVLTLDYDQKELFFDIERFLSGEFFTGE